MKTILVVTKPFDVYKPGDRIEDQVRIDALRQSSNRHKVVAVQVADDSRFSETVH